jgi:hypothetical protein
MAQKKKSSKAPRSWIKKMREKKRFQKVIGESHEKLIKRMEEKIAGSGQKVPYVSNLKKKCLKSSSNMQGLL